MKRRNDEPLRRRAKAGPRYAPHPSVRRVVEVAVGADGQVDRAAMLPERVDGLHGAAGDMGPRDATGVEVAEEEVLTECTGASMLMHASAERQGLHELRLEVE